MTTPAAGASTAESGADSTTPALEVRDLTLSLPTAGGRVEILRGISFAAYRGEITGIAGESGSGKSMTGRSVLNVLPAGAEVTGSILFRGRELLGLAESDWENVRGSDMAMVFQDSAAALHPMLTIGTQLTEHMRLKLGFDKRRAAARAAELLDRVRIPQARKVLGAYPHQLSGGMRQRVAIAVALACEPAVLIADEPTTALDVTVQAGILTLLDELAHESGLAVVFITHDLGVLASLAHHTYVFYAGLVMERGPTGQVLTRPKHPYTGALLEARPPGLREERRPLHAIPGNPVVAGQAPPGCPFAPRCRFVTDACTEVIPPLVDVGAGRAHACLVAPELAAAAL